MEQPTQLPLGISIQDNCSYANFHPGNNHVALNEIHAGLNSETASCITLLGNAQVGKSHCLQASCQYLAQKGKRVGYFPLALLKIEQPDLLVNLDSLYLVCIDDLHLVAHDVVWQKELCRLYNLMQDREHKLMFASSGELDDLSIATPDLLFRLKSDSIVRLQELNDRQKTEALQLRCENRGIELPKESAEYIIKRWSREMRLLHELVDSLINSAITQRRRLTIPFIRQETGLS